MVTVKPKQPPGTDKGRTLQPQDESEVKDWPLPSMAPPEAATLGKTNAFNRTSEWRYEPPEDEVDELTLPTAEEIEAIRQAAQQEGYQQGYNEGKQEGFEEGKQQGLTRGLEEGREQGQREALEATKGEIDEQAARFEQLMSQLHQPIARVDRALEQELVKLAMELARAVIRVEVNTNENVILDALSAGLNVLPVQESRYQIRMHPDDIQLIRQHFTAEELDKHQWQLIDAPQLKRGGCDIVTQTNAVDVTLERRLRDVMDKFMLEQGLGQVRADDPAPSPSKETGPEQPSHVEAQAGSQQQHTEASATAAENTATDTPAEDAPPPEETP